MTLSIGETYGAHYELPCSKEGKIVYELSENIYPATVTYENCSDETYGANGVLRTSMKDGTILIDGKDDNISVVFRGDFNHSMSVDEQRADTIIHDSSSINVLFKTHAVNNLTLSCNSIPFTTNAAAYSIDDANGRTWFYNRSGTVTLSSNKQLTLQDLIVNPAPSNSRAYAEIYNAVLNDIGDFLEGKLLYKYGSRSITVEVNGTNILKASSVQKRIDAFLW